MKKKLWLLFSLGIIVFSVSSFKLNHNAFLIERDQVIDELSIGMKAFGGVIFYIDKTKKHGLVVSVENIGGDWSKYIWGCYGSSIDGAEGIKIGAGRINTNAIANTCADELNAAQACLDYHGEGFTDWYLPSLEELEMISVNLGEDSEFSAETNFDNCNYLTSSQIKNKKHRSNYAWSVNVVENYSMFSYKSTKQKIRPIRAF